LPDWEVFLRTEICHHVVIRKKIRPLETHNRNRLVKLLPGLLW
jgi:hypothetical protein